MERKLMSDFSSDLQKTIEVAKEVSKKVLQLYNTDFDVEIKDDNSPVTQADLLSDRMIFENLVEETDGFISEETEIEKLPLDQEKIWVVDPLDGTKDFVKKTGDFSIMIAMLKDSVPELAVVCLPAHEKIFFAERGRGSYVYEDDKITQLKVSPTEEIQDYRMVISRTYFSAEEQAICDELKVTDLKKVGSVGIKLSKIASGEADFYLNTSQGLGQWDGCAPYLILKEAGGVIFDKKGNELKFNGETWNLVNGLVGVSSEKYKEDILRVING